MDRRTSAQKAFDEKWKELNEEGRCGRCQEKFTESNPDSGGGMCQKCWPEPH